nr:MAG TPA: hypothetical protein [Caudoviricetes sp.]
MEFYSCRSPYSRKYSLEYSTSNTQGYFEFL